MVLTMLPATALADGEGQGETHTVTTQGELEIALASAVAGDVILCNGGTYTASNTAPLSINVEGLTLKGTNGAVIQVSGGNQPIQMNGNGTTLEGFSISKTDSTDQDIVFINGNNVTLRNNTFSGQYTMGASEITRGILVSSGKENITIEGNTFQNLRQPMYINGAVTGTVSRNIVSVTRGFVVAGDSQVTFTDNQFAGNAVDIAIINNNNPTNTYTAIAAMSRNNNGAFVENQLVNASAMEGCIVVDAEGGQHRNSIVSAINAAQNGDTVLLKSDVAVDKMLDIAVDGVTLDLGGHKLTASDDFTSTYENDSHLVNVTGANVTIKNGTLQTTTANKHGLNVYDGATAIVENLVVDHTNAFTGAPVVVNGSDLTVKGQFTMVTGEKSWYAMNVDNKTANASADTTVTFAENAAVVFSGVSSFGISLETNKESAVSKVVFQPNVSLTVRQQFAVVFNGETQKSVTEVVNPQNAGLVEAAENVYVKGATVSVVVDGAIYQSAVVVPGTHFTLPAAPSKDSYLFSGWSDGVNTYNAGDVVTISQNTTFTALWTYLPPVIVPPTTGGNTGSSNTVTNPDGSTTTTVTKPDGTVTVTDKDTQGNVTETVTNPNGTSTTTVTNTDGSSSVTTVGQNGKVEAQVTLSQSVIAAAGGEAVALPMAAVSVTSSQAAAPVVTIDLPAGTSAKVEIPVNNPTAGTVAVLVKADGSQEIVKTSVATADGVVLTVADGAAVMILDNSKDFADVSASYWGGDAIDFATSRDLFNGTSATTFSPDAPMNRAMIVTVLARMMGVDTSAGSTWYEAGQQWAIAAGISDGSAMEQNLSREQLATMLYRYMGSPAVSAAAIAGFADAESVSDWAVDAMAWAVSQGIIGGSNSKLDPQGSATRAQVATMLMRFMTTM